MYRDERGAPVLSGQDARQGRNAGLIMVLVASMVLVIVAFVAVALVYWQVV